jgi:galactokinase
MDQTASLNGRASHAMVLDCRSLELRYIRIPDTVSLVVCNTMVKHSLAGGEYNARRAECEEGVRYFAKLRPGITALRDVTEGDLLQFGEGLPQRLLRRCRHVITENARVLRAADALAANELEVCGQLMFESHDSLKNDYEVSCPELDVMVELAKNTPGTYGARMTGGGFGGCTINLVARDAVPQFIRVVAAGYREKIGITPEIYVTEAVDGAGPA